MAYFSNGSEGECFDEQCSRCKYGQMPCPIALVQHEYNYDACNNETARKILDTLVKDSGDCAMFEMAKSDFEIIIENNTNKFLEKEIKELFTESYEVEFNNYGSFPAKFLGKKKGFYFVFNDVAFVICSTIENEHCGSFVSYEVFHFESGIRCTEDLSFEIVMKRTKWHLSEGKEKFISAIDKVVKEFIENNINYPVNKL